MMGVMIQTAFLVIAILAVQKLLGDKLHAYVRYGLWLLVALRLMIPVNFIDSPLSMLRVTETIQQSEAGRLHADWLWDNLERIDLFRTDSKRHADALTGQEASLENILQSTNAKIDTENVSPIKNAENTMAETAYIGANIGRQADNIFNTLQTDDADRTGDDVSQKEKNAARRTGTKRMQSIITETYLSGMVDKLLFAIRLTGCLLVGGFLGFCHFRFRRRLRKFREVYSKDLPNIIKETRVPVYRVKDLETPCLVGLVHPAIYIGTDIDTITDHFRYTVTHEEVHYLHRDHIWAFVRAALVVIYWFHPFVWIAAILSARDGEIACDYGTVRRLGQEERFAYGEMLLSLSKLQREKSIYSYGTMLRPGKSELKRRILRLTQVSGSRVWAGILAVMLMVIVMGCAFTGSPGTEGGNGDQEVLMGDEMAPDSTDEATDDNGSKAADGGDDWSNRDNNKEADGSENAPDSENSYNMEPRQLEAKPAEISGDTPFGVDGPRLDYAGGMETDQGSRIIFHDYFGLIVYDLDNREITRSLDLASIGCDKTQGDDTCQVAVSGDGATVWLHPMSKRYMYRYEVENNLLYQEPLVKTFEVDLETKELFNRYSTSEEESTYWHSNYLYEEYKDEKGLHKTYIYLYVFNMQGGPDSELVLRNLECTWDDMEFKLFEDSAELQDGTEIPEAVQDNMDMSEAAQDYADIPEEIKHKRFQDDQTDEESETTATDGFPYSYNGGVKDVKITYDKPCNYTRISGVFGGRTNPVTGEVIVHDGIDFVADESTDITAAADGVVYEKGYSAKYGNYVVLLHINGEMTYYCQCKEITVKKDDQVKRGDKIATVGQTGQATGPHLHFALSRHGWFVNPESYMDVILDLN